MTNGIFVGLSTLDVVYSVDEFPASNSKVAARSQEVFVGGPATNASITFGHLGGKPALVTVVGCGQLATVVRDELRRYSIQLIDLDPNFDMVPTISSISVNRAGERNIISANAGGLEAIPARVDESVLSEASVVLIDGHYMQACKAWAKAAHARGIRVVLDGGSWKEGTQELIRSVDTVICSADFLPPKCSTADDVLNYLKSQGVANIALTRGGGSIRFVSGLTQGIVKIPEVEPVDTMGAGDIFHGAYCYYASTGLGFVEALSEAARIATDSCRFHGTREWMKNSKGPSPLPGALESHSGADRHQYGKRGTIIMNDDSSTVGPVQEGSPRDLGKDQPNRRDFIWYATAAILGNSLLQSVLMTPDFKEKMEEYNRRRKAGIERNKQLHELLNCYLYPSNPGSDLEARVPLIPAMQDPWGPPQRKFSGSGNSVAAAYVSAFSSWNDKQIVEPSIDVRSDDAPVLIASHLVSAHAAKYFGDPKSTHPIHQTHFRDSFGGFKANLRWAIYTPEGSKVVNRLELFQGTPMTRSEPVHHLSDLDNPKLHQPVFTRQGEIDYQQDDYLLITVLPRDSRFDRRMISLAGLHKPGTLAAEQLLSDPDLTLRILKAIDERVDGVPYYQALVAVKVDHKNPGNPRPFDLELRGAEAINGVVRL